MPEGPEVKILVKNLKKKYKGDILECVKVLSGKYLRETSKCTTIDNLKIFNKALPLKILKIKCKGKFIYIEFEKEWYMFMSLALKGRIVTTHSKHNRVEFKTNKNKFYFRDLRNFGVINFYNDKKILDKKLKCLGLDILNKENSNKELFNFIKAKLKKIRNQNELIGDKMLDQKIFCGVGNYIRADALYDAKISPFIKIKDLDDEQLKKIIKSLKKIMNKSYDQQKECLLKKEYVYEEVTECYEPLVYFRKETKCGEKIEKKKMKFQNRMIWWVPEVQK